MGEKFPKLESAGLLGAKIIGARAFRSTKGRTTTIKDQADSRFPKLESAGVQGAKIKGREELTEKNVQEALAVKLNKVIADFARANNMTPEEAVSHMKEFLMRK